MSNKNKPSRHGRQNTAGRPEVSKPKDTSDNLLTKSGQNCKLKTVRLTKSLKKATTEIYTEVIQKVDKTPQGSGWS